METTLGVLVLFGLLALSIWGLVMSSRQADKLDASRRARPGVQTVHPAEQQSEFGAAKAHPSFRRDTGDSGRIG